MRERTIIKKILFFNYAKISIKKEKYGKLVIETNIINGAPCI